MKISNFQTFSRNSRSSEYHILFRDEGMMMGLMTMTGIVKIR